MADKTNTSSSSLNNLSTYANSLSVEAKQRYSTKLLYNTGTKSLPDPYAIAEKWSSDPSTWPDLTFGDIYLYLIDTPSIYTKESMKAYKSLDAYNYVVSGHVQVVFSHPVDDCPFMVLKAKVTPSQRARDKPHEPWVYLEKSSGTVYCAHCTCMAGLGEVCSHVEALLFKVEMAVKIGITQTSSTSKAFMTPSIDNPPASKTTESKYPPLLSTLQQTDNNDINDLCDKTIDSYTVSQYQAENLEEATRNQAISSLWYQHRMGRITASKAHDVLVRKATTAANLVKRIAGYSTYDLSKKQSVKWGVDHEDECRQAYTNHQQNHHLDLTCSPCGFFIHTIHPFLGVSPDGIVNCKCCGRGTLEVKCPFKHKDVTVPQTAKKVTKTSVSTQI
ncbi:unnamed protein product [Mytilus coruscus]|uniref:SWIM-type domain-containing protein n=1 Tax=Mytilus coruscus TaxID=42192 RepID=A0A6J8EMU2_MYTCO|nr:unnamed protein product [Mytilus coruscus]